MTEKFTEENLKGVETATANLKKLLDGIIKKYCYQDFDTFKEKANESPESLLKQLGEVRILYVKASKEYFATYRKYEDSYKTIFDPVVSDKPGENYSLRRRLSFCHIDLSRVISEIDVIDEAFRNAREYKFFKKRD